MRPQTEASSGIQRHTCTAFSQRLQGTKLLPKNKGRVDVEVHWSKARSGQVEEGEVRLGKARQGMVKVHLEQERLVLSNKLRLLHGCHADHRQAAAQRLQSFCPLPSLHKHALVNH